MNPVAKLGCDWVFFPMQTLAVHSQVQINFNNTTLTIRSLTTAVQICNTLPQPQTKEVMHLCKFRHICKEAMLQTPKEIQ